MSIIYYTEEEFADVVFDMLAKQCIRLKADPTKDMTVISFTDGRVDYALRGHKVLTTKRDDPGFRIVYMDPTPF